MNFCIRRFSSWLSLLFLLFEGHPLSTTADLLDGFWILTAVHYCFSQWLPKQLHVNYYINLLFPWKQTVWNPLLCDYRVFPSHQSLEKLLKTVFLIKSRKLCISCTCLASKKGSFSKVPYANLISSAKETIPVLRAAEVNERKEEPLHITFTNHPPATSEKLLGMRFLRIFKAHRIPLSALEKPYCKNLLHLVSSAYRMSWRRNTVCHNIWKS